MKEITTIVIKQNHYTPDYTPGSVACTWTLKDMISALKQLADEYGEDTPVVMQTNRYSARGNEFIPVDEYNFYGYTESIYTGDGNASDDGYRFEVLGNW